MAASQSNGHGTKCTLDDSENHEASLPLLASPAPNDTLPISYGQRLTAISKLSYPIMLSEIFQNSLPLMDIIFVSRLGKEELGAAALATAWFNLWNTTMLGFMTAVDTLLSQSFGANRYEQYGILTGVSLLIVFVATIPMSGALALCAPVMHLCGQDPKLVNMANDFCYRLIPGLFPLYAFKVLTKYLQTQHILAQGIWIGIFANICNGVFNWALIFKAGWGICGSPWASTLTRTIELIVIIAYMFIRKSTLDKTWPQFSRSYLTLTLLKEWCSLGLYGALSMWASGCLFEITTILAGLLGTVPLSAHVITITLDGLLFMSFPFSIGIATTIQVGKLMGDQNPQEARRSSHVFYFFNSTVQIVLIVILLLCRDQLADLLCKDKDVSSLVAELIVFMCAFMLGDSIGATNNGVLRGMGRQTLILIINTVGMWVVGLSLGAMLAFVARLGVYGIWWGIAAGVYTTAFIGLFTLTCLKWEEESKKTFRRLSSITTSSTSTGDSDTYISSSNGHEGESVGE